MVRWLHFGLLTLAACLIFAGCANDTTPQAGADKKYRPADETPAPVLPDGGAPSTAAGKSADPLAAAPAGGNELALSGPSPSLPADNPYQLPSTNDARAMLAFIDKLAQQEPKGTTRDELLTDFQHLQYARLAAMDRVLSSNPPEQLKIQLVQSKLAVFRELERVQSPGATARLKEFTTALQQDKDPQLARFGRFMQFDKNVSALASAGLTDGKEVMAEVKTLLAGDKGSPEAYELAEQATQVLAQQGLKEDAVATLRLIAEQLKAETDPALVKRAATVESQAKIVEADIANLSVEILTNKPESDAKLLASVQGLLKEKNPDIAFFEPIRETAQTMEFTGQTKIAGQLYDALKAAYGEHENKELATAASEMLGRAQRRLALLGQPFSVEGLKTDGSPFDWKAYEGKVVLVDFWATWCGPCLEELPNIQKNYADFKDRGFEVLGVNLNQEIGEVEQFFAVQQLPWTSVVSQDVLDKKEIKNWSDLPMAAKFGVDAIPFLVLVGKDGKVDSLHLRGPKLRARLVELLGAPAGEKPAEEKPAAEKPAAEKPAAEAKPATEEKGGSCDDAPAAEAAAKEPTEANVYAAKAGLMSGELVSYILKMLDKPRTIQARPGFGTAIVEACDRVLAIDPPAKETDLLVAAEAKFETLHKMACAGDEAADKQLTSFVEQMKVDARPRIARQVAFFQHERKVLDAAAAKDELPAAHVAALLKEVCEYCGKEKLAAQHLRLASTTVALINKLADGDEREKQFTEFGGLFAKMPVYTAMAMGLFFAGLGLPGLCGFIGEVFVVLSVWNYSVILAVLSASVVVLTAAYILWAVQRVYLGAEYRGPHEEHITPSNLRENMIGMTLLGFAILFGVFPYQTVLKYMDKTIERQTQDLAHWTQTVKENPRADHLPATVERASAERMKGVNAAAAPLPVKAVVLPAEQISVSSAEIGS